MEGGEGGPTSIVIREWIKINGRNATVEVLLRACNRCERKDCVYSIEKHLGCRLDVVDSPAEATARKVESSSE